VRRATTSQLRGAIDRGETRDKVRALDPAAAPLGTDDEAAGHGPAEEIVASTLTRELRRSPRVAPRRLSGVMIFLILIFATLLTFGSTFWAIIAWVRP